ncbi:MAG TPA: hypothetical protein VFV57_04585 [Limnobacter sp.]|nr:hypothetical protein [Limnobacter sp.]
MNWRALTPLLLVVLMSSNSCYAIQLQLSRVLSYGAVGQKHDPQQDVLLEVVYADGVREPRVGRLISNQEFVADNQAFKGAYNETRGEFVVNRYVKTHDQRVNFRPVGLATVPTVGAWSLGWNYRLFKSPQSKVMGELGGNLRYQLQGGGKPGRSDSIVMQSENGFSQLYWSRFDQSTVDLTDARKTGPTAFNKFTQYKVGKLFLQPDGQAARSVYGVQYLENAEVSENFLLFEGRLYEPSQVQVLVNDRLRFNTTGQPGPMSLFNVPLDSGANQVRVLVRQKDGTLQEFNSLLYVSPRLLPAGAHDWKAHAGVNPQRNQVESSVAYGHAPNAAWTVRSAVNANEDLSARHTQALAVQGGLLYFDWQSKGTMRPARTDLNYNHAYGSAGFGLLGKSKTAMVTGRWQHASVSLRKGLNDDFALAQLTYSQVVNRLVVSNLFCSVTRDVSSRYTRFCGVSATFLLDRGVGQFSVSKASGLQDGYSVQGGFQKGDNSYAFLSTPDLSLARANMVVNGVDTLLAADTLGGATLGLGGSVVGQGSQWIGRGRNSQIEQATLAVDSPGEPLPFLNGMPMVGGVATNVPLAVPHRVSLNPESVPMEVDLETFTQDLTPRLPGVYVLRFNEVQIDAPEQRDE